MNNKVKASGPDMDTCELSYDPASLPKELDLR